MFGSYADGRANEWSDIDIALVSDSFDGDRFDDRSKIRRITLSVSSDLSPLPFRPEDFTPENPFVKEIMEKESESFDWNPATRAQSQNLAKRDRLAERAREARVNFERGSAKTGSLKDLMEDLDSD